MGDPRMVGFVPNDCSLSPLRRMLMRTQPTADIVAGWRDAMPTFMAAYERSGLMPDAEPGTGLSTSMTGVELVDTGRVRIVAPVRALDEDGAVFADGSGERFDANRLLHWFPLPRVPFLDCIQPTSIATICIPTTPAWR